MAKNDTLLMMNAKDEDLDLGLALGSNSYGIQPRLKSSSGAGVNANLRGDMAFAASDPLSELVWLPHKGLSLKCADSSSADKKPYLLWNVGPSNKVLSPSQVVGSQGREDGIINVGSSTVSQTCVNANSKVDDRATSASPVRIAPTPALDAKYGPFEETNGKRKKGGGITDAYPEEVHLGENREENLGNMHVIEVIKVAEASAKTAEQDILPWGNSNCEFHMTITGQKASDNHNENIQNIADDSGTLHANVAIGSEPRPAKPPENHLSSPQNIQTVQEPDNEVMSATGEVNKNNVVLDLMGAPVLVKLECTAENELHHPTAEKSQTSSDDRRARCNSLSVEKSPTSSRIQLYREKGKGKALSDADANGRSSDNEEDSRESAESCNSAGLFSKGIKRSKCEGELAVESKRMKKQIQATHASTSIINHDSSFMNWISNMVNGVQDPSIALTLADSNDPDQQETVMFDKTHDAKTQNMGFQAMFQSLYCSNTEISDNGVLKDNYSIEESKDHLVAEETFLENRPRSCYMDKDSPSKQIVMVNEVDLPISRNIVGMSSEPWIVSEDCANETNTTVNKASHDLEIKRGTDLVSSSCTLGKQVNCTAENTSLNFPSRGKETCIMHPKSNPLSSLWITRLSVRTTELENCNWSTEQVPEGSTDCTKVNPDTQVGSPFPMDQEISKEINKVSAHGEASVNVKSINKQNSIQPVQKFESSEAMASVFAKRLDALRHIVPSEKTKSSTCKSPPCLFCGKIGHGLRECSEVTETELKDLIRKINLFDSVEESRCLCIRCSQLDHWAVTCPQASSSVHRQSEHNASFITHGSRHLMFCSGSDKFGSYLGREEDFSQVASDRKAHSFRKFLSDSAPSNLTWDVKELMGERIYEVNRCMHSKTDFNEYPSLPLSKVLSSQNEYSPVEMFEAIRKLRLSRVDILRWMSFPISQSQLNGFFVRLRLGKWTEWSNKDESQPAQLGGTGYYVACITGAERENIGSSSKNSIFADVEGFKCSIESQYVSNHDFLEDEIKAWWCRIVKSGGKIPSLDELKSKFEERKVLGF